MTDPGEAPAELDRQRLREAIELSRNCPPSRTAFSVGAIVTDASGGVLATGYSREVDPHDHAEETALRKLRTADGRIARGRSATAQTQAPAADTIYSSLEPCGARKSRERACTQLILDAGIPRVVLAWREPSTFVVGCGAETLREAGVTVVEVPELAARVRDINAHLVDR